MAKQWQLRRGTTIQNDEFTGALAEVTVDTSTHELRVHDGTTQGGFTIPLKSSFATVATSGLYSDLSGRPTIPGTAADVGALPDSTKYAASVSLSMDSSTYILTLQLQDQDGNNLGTAQTLDLPLESFIINGEYNAEEHKIILTLQNGNKIEIALSDLISGLQPTISTANPLNADYVNDTNSVHKFVTTQNIATWNAKADSSSLAAVAKSGLYDDLLETPIIPDPQVNADWDEESGIAAILNKPNLSTVATSGSYNDLSDTPSLATVATSGSYNDLSDLPTIPDAQINADWDEESGIAAILNKPTLATVAISGSYGDLFDLPVIPDAQVNADWDEESGIAAILNKPTLGTMASESSSDYTKTQDLSNVATSGSYTDLIDTPVVDQIYDSTSTNAQSGIAISQALFGNIDCGIMGEDEESGESGESGD